MPSGTLVQTRSIVRKVVLTIWLAVLVGGLLTYLIYPEAFTAKNIADFLARFSGEIWLIYFAMSALRGVTLLPSTPLVIAGTLVFPTQPFAVLAVSLAGIGLSSTIIYFFSEHFGLADYFEGHKPDLIHRIKAGLDQPLGVIFVAAWAFFPLVPTDLVCYVAGTAKMNFARFIAAVLAGELVLCSIYVFGSGLLRNLLL